MLTESQIEARKRGIGGSDVAAILGLSRWKTPFQVYQEKRGEADSGPVDNDAIRWGNYLEPVIRQAYADQTGREVRLPDQLIVHPHHEFMIANIDGFADRRIFEAKTARSAEDWGEPGSDEIPQAYALQVQHYMEVSGFEVADVAVLIGGSDFRIYEVPADRELQQMLVEAEAEFWGRVQRGDAPEPVSVADAMARYGRSSRSHSVVSTIELDAEVDALRAIRQQIKAAEIREEAAKAVVLAALGDSDTLIDPAGNVLCTWKQSKPSVKTDWEALAKSFSPSPEQIQRFTSEKPGSRRFLLK